MCSGVAVAGGVGTSGPPLRGLFDEPPERGDAPIPFFARGLGVALPTPSCGILMERLRSSGFTTTLPSATRAAICTVFCVDDISAPCFWLVDELLLRGDASPPTRGLELRDRGVRLPSPCGVLIRSGFTVFTTEIRCADSLSSRSGFIGGALSSTSCDFLALFRDILCVEVDWLWVRWRRTKA